MRLNIKKIIFLLALSLFAAGSYFIPKFINEAQWRTISKEAKAAALGFPAQFGLVNTASIPCVPVEPSGACPNHPLCALKPPHACGSYTVIAGTPAGGNGSAIILDQAQYSASGYKPGDSVIAAGISGALINVAATPGGCFGCQ